MKQLILSLITTGLTASAFSQGAIQIDNVLATGYLDNQYLGNHYSGVFGVELWYKNSTAAADDTINAHNGVDSYIPYALLASHGFTLATHINPGAPGTTAVGGIVAGLGQVNIPGIDRTGNPQGNALFGIAFWLGNSSSYLLGTKGGALTFNNPTSDYTIPPPYTPVSPGLDNWSTDLIMFIPEPSSFALAGLGAALIVLRRRNC